MRLTVPTSPWQRTNSRRLMLCAIIAALRMTPVHAQQQAFSVKDDIAMVRFNDPSEDRDTQENDSENYSPDGKHVAIVTTQGLLATDQVRSTVSVFDVDRMKQFLSSPSIPQPGPRVVASVTAVSQGQTTIAYAPIIHDLRWADDGKHIYFRGQNERGGYQLYQARTNGKGFRILTPASEDVDRFDVAGETIAYTAARMDAPVFSPGVPINRDALDATGVRSNDILFPGQLKAYVVNTFSMFTLRLGKHPSAPRPVPGYSVRDNTFFQYLFPFRLSPDGHWLVSAEPLAGAMPRFWEAFDPIPLFEHRRLRADDPDLTRPDNVLRSRRYSLTDLRTGITTVLVDAPSAEFLGYVADVNRVVWSEDGTRILLTNLYFPPDPSNGGAPLPNAKPCAVASVDLSSLHRRCLYFDGAALPWSAEHVADVSFGGNRNETLVTLKEDTGERRTIAFHRIGDVWSFDPQNSTGVEETRRQDAAHHGNVRVYMKQDLNVAPTLWVSDVITKRARQLWDPNPQLRQLSFGQASVYRWKDPSGRDWIGGLVKPVGYIPGHRYPLVIQMYVFREHQFLTDGTEPSAFAARQLASAGFIVLQVRKQPNVLSDQDAQTSLTGYTSAVQRLSDEGLIDSHRVGVVGFSWTCWYAVNALVKSPRLFAAATIADGLDNSYIQYMFGAPSQPNLEAQMNQIRGGSPFGAGLERWVRESPGFHLDQVQTPVRIEAIGPDSIVGEWELYGSLYMQHKPVDLIYFPNGTHVHQMPLERLESQQGNIDWMRYWLQGYEDPDPAKRAQYDRWESMSRDLSSGHSSDCNQHGR